MMRLMKPVDGERNWVKMPPSTTQDRKWGKYDIVCTTFLKRALAISFSKIASRMGAGNPNKMRNALIKMVLRNTS